MDTYYDASSTFPMVKASKKTPAPSCSETFVYMTSYMNTIKHNVPIKIPTHLQLIWKQGEHREETRRGNSAMEVSGVSAPIYINP